MDVFKRISTLFEKLPHLKKATYPSLVKLNEVGPRDGLQAEPNMVATNYKHELINRLTNARMPFIECTSFISSKYSPQMVDSRVIAPGLQKEPSTTKYQVFAPNEDSVEVAAKQGYDEIVFLTSACKETVEKNMKCSLSEMIDTFKVVTKKAESCGLTSRGYLSCAMGSPENKHIDPQIVNELAHELIALGCREISIADNYSFATPEMIQNLLETLTVPKEKLAVHFHDSQFQGIENVIVAMANGISVVDCSVAGLGQCAYNSIRLANIPSEEMLFVLQVMGIDTGKIKWRKLLDAGDFISDSMTRENLSDVFDIDFEEEMENYQEMYAKLIQ